MQSRTRLAAAALMSLFMSGRAGAECNANTLCPSDPCTIIGTHRLDEGCDLSFEDKDVTIAGSLDWLTPTDARLDARNLTVRGRISGVGDSITIETAENFTMQWPGKILVRGKHEFYDGYDFQGTADVSVEAGGEVSLAGALIRAQGSLASVQVSGTNVTVDQKISVRSCSEDAALIDLTSETGSIVTRKRLEAKACGPSALGLINMGAGGNISVEGSVRLSGGKVAGENFGMTLEADGDVRLDKAVLFGPNAGGFVEIQAGGNVLVGSIKARGRGGTGYYSDGLGGTATLESGVAGTVRVTKRIDLSCRGSNCAGGDIFLAGGCYTDVSGASFRATPDGPIALGCSCIHTGTDCDGGCVGLDSAKFTPAVATNLPPCS